MLFSAFIATTKKKAFPKVGEERTGFRLQSLSRASFENIQPVQPDRPSPANPAVFEG